MVPSSDENSPVPNRFDLMKMRLAKDTETGVAKQAISAATK